MKRLMTYFSNNTILVNFLCVLMLLVGVLSIISIQKESKPPVELDKVYIRTIYSGASAIDVENLVAVPIEEKVAKVANLDRVDSTSAPGGSFILIDIDPDVFDKGEVIDEVFRSVNEVKDLPSEIEDPEVVRIRARRWPIIRMAIYGGKDEMELRYWAKRLQDHLRPLDGVSEVQLLGDRDPAFKITLDPQRLELYSVSIKEIMDVVIAWNRSAPAGNLKTSNKEVPIRIDESLDNVEDIKKLVVRTNDEGKQVLIQDVGRVYEGFRDDKKEYYFNGKKMIQVRVIRKETDDTIETSKGVMAALKKITKTLPSDIAINVYNDDSLEIKERLNTVSQNGILGLILVVIVLLLFLNLRMALITALGLPIAFFASIFVLDQAGMTLNNVTLIGIIIVLGMLVDDGIVVAENIFYHFQQGKTRQMAAIDGTLEIARPVLGTVLTTIVAFFPLLFMKGIVGKFMQLIPISVITCLTFSLLECFFILPNHAADFMNVSRYRLGEYLSQKLQAIYTPLLNFFIKFRWYAVPIFIILITTFTIYYLGNFKMTMFPTRGITFFDFSLEGPTTSQLEETMKIVKVVEKALDGCSKEEIVGYQSSIGDISRRGEIPRAGDYLADFRIYLKYESELKRDPQEIANEMRDIMIPQLPADWILAFELGRKGPPMGKPIEVMIGHEDLGKLKEVSIEVKDFLQTIEGVTDVKSQFDEEYFEYVMKIDQQKAAIMGIDLFSLQKMILSAFEEISLTEVRIRDDNYKIIVTYPEKYRKSLDDLLSLKVKTKYSTYVNLKRLASVELKEGVNALRRIDQRRVAIVSGSLKGKEANSYLINQKIRAYLDIMEEKLPTVSFQLEGEEKERKKAMADIVKLFLVAFVAIYMILALVFSSILWPVIVIVVIPFSFVGAFLALEIHGIVVDVGTLISLVGLTGIVVNDAIILVNYIRDAYKDSAKGIDQVILYIREGALRRLRPIFMTTVTTLVALAPAAYELLGRDSLMKPMALTIGWGLVFSTSITLLILPAIMSCFFDFWYRLKKRIPLLQN